MAEKPPVRCEMMHCDTTMAWLETALWLRSLDHGTRSQVRSQQRRSSKASRASRGENRAIEWEGQSELGVSSRLKQKKERGKVKRPPEDN